ncbi:hypothetical protein B0H17DRAFT_18709 [Mycena rosella]|uniref:Uncharacterized protein n=1 Tax=Mycena rosella TaxID=1033263 RepID=A0AAD7D8X8_MYCRO|nr:hypothetical protein B0H17DRAFT_18709 [Mycena rosella]
MSGMSVLSKISTFFTTTLLCMYAFLLRPFVPRPARHTSSVTPYPLAPDLEGRVIEIAGGSGKCAEKGTDLEQGIFTDRAEQTDLFSGPQALAPKQQRAPNARGISRAMSRSSFTGVKGMKDKTIPAPPLSVVTNSVRPPAPPHKRAASKATGENTALPPRKPTPLRRMPRYLNLTGTSLRSPR